MKDKLQNKADHSQQALGDNIDQRIVENEINIYKKTDRLTRNKMYALLKIVYNSQKSLEGQFDLDIPASIEKKLKYNNVEKYQELFSMYSIYLEDFSKVLANSFFNSQRVIITVKQFFIKYGILKIKDKEIIGDGDKQLEIIFQQLKDYIVQDSHFDENHFSNEDVEDFVYVLMLYCVWKCKLLNNPNMVSGKNDING